ncbi:Oligopeptide/dipeptide ABC transporter, ATPase component [Nitrosotalea devaniterrae]|uniref:Oligopeptide/dipeptide ABC transporter, ATPase component n=1 Tax=Nitrosotalea devaniterrae TaxID=1078905 RepID=A0A128A3K5_9ARCH|nr:Oligopeptide/dipeptide ABC transporter, ATPase component [Candidatus Nitrosotalea devanaterra]
MKSMVTLSVNDLSVQYQSQGKKVQAVDHVTFSFDKNESLGIAGESGCGKSTLGLAIMKTLQENASVSGKILFDGKSILETSDSEFTKDIRWKQISMMFQGAMNSLDPVFTIKKQFEEILKKHNFQGDKKQAIELAISSVGLSHPVLDKYPHEISGGMKQRVIIAMALIMTPRLVIADEPTTALDVLVQAQIMILLKKLKKEGLSIILISHDLGIISEIAEKVGIMYAGQIVEFGNMQEIYKNPKHPYTIALLESIPKLQETKRIIPLKGNPPSLVNPPSGCRFYDRCPQAMEKCKKDPPKIKTESGFVMCWLHE